VIHTSRPVSTRPTTQVPNSAMALATAPPASSTPVGNIARVTNQKAMSDSTPATMRPLYSAGITFFMPGLAFTKAQPMMEAMIDTPPRTSG